MARSTLNERAEKILKIAEHYGVENNFLFINTFKTYLTQIQILQQLEQVIKTDGSIVKKEYVKGRENVYTNPAIKEYNNTANSMGRTVATIMKIIKSSKEENGDSEEIDPLLDALNGSDIDGE